MKKLFLFLALCLSAVVNAQQAVIEGRLLDKANNNEPIIFANVSIKGTEATITTDFRGNYFFKDLVPGTYTLKFSFLGYKTQQLKVEVKSNEKIKVDAFLEPTQAINFEGIELSMLIEK